MLTTKDIRTIRAAGKRHMIKMEIKNIDHQVLYGKQLYSLQEVMAEARKLMKGMTEKIKNK